jgi:epoxyqueuosine reductase
MTPQVNFEKLTQENLKFTIVSTSHLADLRSEIENRQKQNQFNEEFSKEYLFRFKFSLPDELKNAKSLIIVVMPRPATQAIFNWNGKKQTFILPPTYTAYDEKRLYVEHLVTEAVGKEGYKIATPNLPLKLLAVHSGLAFYGKNNIAYVQGMGSFMRLTAVYSDMPCERDQWQEAKMMNSCKDCTLCRSACPTGAITKNRFLLHAEKCLTYHNEKESRIPFPNWIKPEWHNCIVGCIKCQAVCPQNKAYLGQIGETTEFTQEETELLLKGKLRDQIPSATIEKMKALSLTDYLSELPRNLSALLNVR